jgi:hypothetical protein
LIASRLLSRALLPFLLNTGIAVSQQTKPAFEVYGLTGVYFHGNLSVATVWKPQFGGGVLAPFGRNWRRYLT